MNLTETTAEEELRRFVLAHDKGAAVYTSRMFYNFLTDVLARSKKELRLCKIACDAHIPERLFAADKKTYDEQLGVRNESIFILKDDWGIADKAAKETVALLTAGLNWKPIIKYQNQENITPPICAYAVKRADYISVMGKIPNQDVCTWEEAIEYCNKRSAALNLEQCYRKEDGEYICDLSTNGCRLPTKDEWDCVTTHEWILVDDADLNIIQEITKDSVSIRSNSKEKCIDYRRVITDFYLDYFPNAPSGFVILNDKERCSRTRTDHLDSVLDFLREEHLSQSECEDFFLRDF